jgi:hypothetical protein
MTSRQRLRRSVAVPRKLLNLLVRRFAAAVPRRFAGVPKNSIRSMCGGSGAVCAAKPHTPMRSAAPLKRAAGAWKPRGGASEPCGMSAEPLHDLRQGRAVACEMAAALPVRRR